MQIGETNCGGGVIAGFVERKLNFSRKSGLNFKKKRLNRGVRGVVINDNGLV